MAIAALALSSGPKSLAWVTGPKLHPIDLMHGLPRAEEPGWNSKYWIQTELNVANVWNRPMTLVHIPTQQVFSYSADYEQRYWLLRGGMEISKDFAFLLETVYFSRSGGFLDRWIDDSHEALHMGRFKRRDYPENQSHFYAYAGGNRYRAGEAEGFSYLSPEMKYRILQFQEEGGRYDGLSVAARIKIPVGETGNGLSTNSQDYSILAHLGLPLMYGSSLHFSAGHTWLGSNPFFEGWPRYSHIWMYELGLRLGLGENWHLVLSNGSQSPLMNHDDLDFVVPLDELNSSGRYRADPAWYSLAEWRTQQTIGVQYEPAKDSEWTLYFTEDWDMGDRDLIGNWLFISGAPDISVGLNGQFGF